MNWERIFSWKTVFSSNGGEYQFELWTRVSRFSGALTVSSTLLTDFSVLCILYILALLFGKSASLFALFSVFYF